MPNYTKTSINFDFWDFCLLFWRIYLKENSKFQFWRPLVAFLGYIATKIESFFIQKTTSTIFFVYSNRMHHFLSCLAHWDLSWVPLCRRGKNPSDQFSVKRSLANQWFLVVTNMRKKKKTVSFSSLENGREKCCRRSFCCPCHWQRQGSRLVVEQQQEIRWVSSCRQHRNQCSIMQMLTLIKTLRGRVEHCE